jgi:hypothetical protein
MSRCSESVSALATALAKAQIELINPEKLLTATVPGERQQQGRTFRYASLAAGLDIVRKTLGRHEIALVQSTSIDRDTGTIKLTTTLAHSSGEWIASDWPVCGLADLPAPHRMGAALTYARRYSLFCLVGIAGEDDLNAPDLAPPVAPSPIPALPSAVSGASSKSPGKRGAKPTVTLDHEASSKRGETLLAELVSIDTFDGIAEWSKRILPIKNTLADQHAREVEKALDLKLSQFTDAVDTTTVERNSDWVLPDSNGSAEWLATADRSMLKFGHSPRRRNKSHLKFVATQPCLLCSRRPSDAHHLRFAQLQAIGRKVSDEFTVPLCRNHHRQLHRFGNERQWWLDAANNVDPLAVAKELWNRSQGKESPVKKPA